MPISDLQEKTRAVQEQKLDQNTYKKNDFLLVRFGAPKAKIPADLGEQVLETGLWWPFPKNLDKKSRGRAREVLLTKREASPYEPPAWRRIGITVDHHFLIKGVSTNDT